MPNRLIAILIACSLVFPGHAQSVYKLSYYYYPNVLGGRDTTSATARKSDYTIERYDERNQLIAIDRYSAQGGLEDSTRFIVNPEGRITEERYYIRPNATAPLKKFYSYNTQGLLQAKMWRYRNKGDDTITITETYEYDDKARMVRKTLTSHPYGTNEIRTYTYNDLPDGGYKVTSIKRGNDKKRGLKTELFYDVRGNLVREKSQAKITTILYDYNASGEWTRRKTCLRDGALMPTNCYGEWRRERLE